MIQNEENIIHNVTHKMAESVSGFILNQRDKEQFSQYIQPFLYEDALNEQICVKLVITDV